MTVVRPLHLEKATGREILKALAPEHDADLHSVVAVDRMPGLTRIRCSCEADIVFLDADVVAATGRTSAAVHDRLVALGRGPLRVVVP